MKSGYKILKGPGFYRYCQITGVFSVEAAFMMVELDEDGRFYVCGDDESYSLKQMLDDGYFLEPVKRINVYIGAHNEFNNHIDKIIAWLKRKYEKRETDETDKK